MRVLALLVALLIPAIAAAEPAPGSVAEVRAGLGVIGIKTEGGVAADGLSMVRGYSAAGILSGIAAGDVYLLRGFGFAFRYERSRTFTSLIEESGGDDQEFDTVYSKGSLGAVARAHLGGGSTAIGRVAVGRTRLGFTPRSDGTADLAELPESEARFLRLGIEVEQRFGTIQIGAGAGVASAYGISGAAADVMGETRGVMVDGRLSATLALGPSVEIVATTFGDLLSAGEWTEWHYGIDLGVGVRM